MWRTSKASGVSGGTPQRRPGLVGTVDNLIRPWVVVNKLPVHPLVVFVAMLGGIEAFGLMGILFGPVILAVTMALFRMLRDEMAAE